MAVVIQNKKALADFLDKTPLLEEYRAALVIDGGDDEFSDWPEIKKELLKQVWRTDPRPPKYGQDWEAWLKEHLEEAAQEAAEIVL